MDKVGFKERLISALVIMATFIIIGGLSDRYINADPCIKTYKLSNATEICVKSNFSIDIRKDHTVNLNYQEFLKFKNIKWPTLKSLVRF